jgi:proline dehydrogenase
MEKPEVDLENITAEEARLVWEYFTYLEQTNRTLQGQVQTLANSHLKKTRKLEDLVAKGNRLCTLVRDEKQIAAETDKASRELADECYLVTQQLQIEKDYAEKLERLHNNG